MVKIPDNSPALAIDHPLPLTHPTVFGAINQTAKSEVDQWRRGTDTMDVWFDSGSSWAGVAKARTALAYPADLYLEGESFLSAFVSVSLCLCLSVSLLSVSLTCVCLCVAIPRSI